MSRGKLKVAGFMTDYNRPNGKEGIGAAGWYRVKNPLEKLGWKVYGKTIVGGTPEEKLKYALKLQSRGNIWYWKPVDNEGIHVDLDTAKIATGSKIILDLDDALIPNEGHPIYDKLMEKLPRLKYMIHISDHIVASTQELADTLKEFGKQITVIPNAIDPKIWEVKKPKKRTDGKIRIGWIGSGSHITDTPVVNEAFNQILEKYPNTEIHLAGFAPNNTSRGTREFHHKPTNDYTTFPQFVADLDLDIAVAPLMDTPFNRCKSNIKWLEHSMLEIPMVLSDVTPYKECVKNYKTGYLAASTSQWVKYLSWLIENEEKRKEIGKAAKEEVLKNYLIEKQLPKYTKLFKKMFDQDITVYTSLVGGIDELNEGQNVDGASFWAFTDHPSQTWTLKPAYDKFKDPRRNSRIQKIMPHMFMKCEYSIYMDANIELLVPPQKLIDEFLKDKDIAVFKHAGRDDIYQERDAIIYYGKEEPPILFEQTTEYTHRGIQEHSGLSECGVIIRRHTPRIAELNERWWAEYCRFGVRDQMSFPIAFPMDEINQINGSAYTHPYFKMINHKK